MIAVYLLLRLMCAAIAGAAVLAVVVVFAAAAGLAAIIGVAVAALRAGRPTHREESAR